MVFSELLLTIPYNLGLLLTTLLKRREEIGFYCHEIEDFYVLENLINRFENPTIIAKNRSIKDKIPSRFNIKLIPSFPKVVIMARHSLHKFPSPFITKIGLRHGPYHFKRFISPVKYNRFNLFLFTSPKEVDEAKGIGIKSGCYGGYPKLDSYRRYLGEVDDRKRTILFSATYTKSGVSCLDRWIDRVEELSDRYEIYVTIHPFNDQSYRERLRSIRSITFIESGDLIPYLKKADILVSDSSSIIGEFIYQLKPVILFNTPLKDRFDPSVYKSIRGFGYIIDQFDEINSVLDTISEGGMSSDRLSKMEQFRKDIFGDVEDHSEQAFKMIDSYLKGGISL
jgi:CDP-glycerol glycerophosphotransferase (TagB/SpsB family)